MSDGLTQPATSGVLTDWAIPTIVAARGVGSCGLRVPPGAQSPAQGPS
jgi:hypothetical protein